MDELGGFEPTDASGFIEIESIRIKKCVFPFHSLFLISRADRHGVGGHRRTFARARAASLPRMSMAPALKLSDTDHSRTDDNSRC